MILIIGVFGCRYRPRDPKMSAEPIRFKAGTNQTYTNSLHTFNPSQFPDTDLQYDFDKEVFPIVIQCVSLDDGDYDNCLFHI